MNKHQSSQPGDFSLREIPGLLAPYLVLAACSVGLGLFLESPAESWRGVILVAGAVLVVGLLWFRLRVREIEASLLRPVPARVEAVRENPNGSLVEVVRVGRAEAGLGLNEAKTILNSYRATEASRRQNHVTRG